MQYEHDYVHNGFVYLYYRKSNLSGRIIYLPFGQVYVPDESEHLHVRQDYLASESDYVQYNACNTSKNTFQTNLNTCTTDKAAIQTSLTTCSTDKTTLQTNLTACSAAKTTCETSLLACNSEKTVAQSNLQQCQSTVATGAQQLTECQNKTATAEANLAKSQQAASRWGKARISPIVDTNTCLARNTDGTLTSEACDIKQSQIFWYDLEGNITPKAIIDPTTEKCLSASQQKFVTCDGSKDQSWVLGASFRSTRIVNEGDSSKCLTQFLTGRLGIGSCLVPVFFAFV
ncbi:hypothetical protein BGZ73_005535 [Actinomortierella ambigua]|nr:hypothetical protein BGZ73_005535 [Actinomortierella ambigua]